MTSLSQRVAELEGLLERGERDRNSLNGQLEEAYKKLTAQETESSKVQPSESLPHNRLNLLIWIALFLMHFWHYDEPDIYL